MIYRCPEDFELSDRSRAFARKNGLTEKQLEDAFDEMLDFEFKTAHSDWDATFRNWVRRGIRWGTIIPARTRGLPEELSTEQRKADILAFERDPLIRKALGK